MKKTLQKMMGTSLDRVVKISLMVLEKVEEVRELVGPIPQPTYEPVEEPPPPIIEDRVYVVKQGSKEILVKAASLGALSFGDVNTSGFLLFFDRNGCVVAAFPAETIASVKPKFPTGKLHRVK